MDDDKIVAALKSIDGTLGACAAIISFPLYWIALFMFVLAVNSC